MAHLSSRFRLSKKSPGAATPAGAAASLTVDGQPPAAASHRRPILPTLSTTAPSTTSDHHPQPLLKSPSFRNYFKSPHKRARSPAPASLPQPQTPAVVSPDGVVEPDLTSPMKTDTPVMSTQKDRETSKVGMENKPKIPGFLELSEQDIEAKFQDIIWLERDRLLKSVQNPSPTFQYARITDPSWKLLDRYNNIQPWANNRVRLSVPENKTDYINASPIILQSPFDPEARPDLRYIAMQGPKQATTEHAWRMVAEQLQSPAVIVMLTETHEMGMEKCFPYFPKGVDDAPIEIGEHDEFDDGFRATVKCIGVEHLADGAIEVREISLHVEGRDDDMVVWHLFYRRWPDFGVPAMEDLDSFFKLMQLSREKNVSEDNPRIIHCSAGVGRSGTFITLEHLMRELDAGALENYDERPNRPEQTEDGDGDDLVYDTVNRLREQRKQMVQSEPQYLFIYQVLRKLWFDKYGQPADTTQEPAAKRLEVANDPFVER